MHINIPGSHFKASKSIMPSTKILWITIPFQYVAGICFNGPNMLNNFCSIPQQQAKCGLQQKWTGTFEQIISYFFFL